MTNLKSISGIGNSSVDLLEAAGFQDVESLAKAGVDELVEALAQAGDMLQTVEMLPDRTSVEQWIFEARTLSGIEQGAEVEMVMPVNHESAPEVARLLSSAPLAIPLPAKLLKAENLAVSDIPAGILLNRYSGDLEVRVENRVPVPKPSRPALHVGNVRIAETSATRLDIDTSRIKSTDTLAGAAPKSSSSRAANMNDRVALIRGPKEETNRGRNPQSRRYIRGVLHSHPLGLRIGAIVTLVMMILLPLGVVSAALLLLSREVPQRFGWVPEWLLLFPVSLPVFGIMYMIWGTSGSCRICGQKQFVPKACLKNTKAHRIRGLGHIIPVCLHILLFQWFRCTYCGTPVRLKE
jgi:hypothetical protein